MKLSIKVAAAFLSVVSLAHLLRLVMRWPITINGLEVPLWLSAPAFLVTGALALWLWQDHKV